MLDSVIYNNYPLDYVWAASNILLHIISCGFLMLWLDQNTSTVIANIISWVLTLRFTYRNLHRSMQSQMFHSTLETEQWANQSVEPMSGPSWDVSCGSPLSVEVPYNTWDIQP